MKCNRFDLVRAAAERFARGREHQLDIARRGEDDRALELMVVQIARGIGVDLGLPDRVGRCEPISEQRMNRSVEARRTAFLRLHPMNLLLPGMAEQLGEFPAPRRDCLPVDRHPVHVQLRGGGRNRFGVLAFTVERADREPLAIASGKARTNGGDQRRMRAKLEERVDAGVYGLVDRPPEQHRLAHVAAPIVGVELLTLDSLSGNAREHCNIQRIRPQTAKAVAQLAR